MRTAFSTDGAPTLSPTPRQPPSALHRLVQTAGRECSRRGRTNVNDCCSAVHASSNGSVTARLMCIPIQSTYEYKTRGEEQRHCPPRGKADAQTRHPCHAKMSSRAPSKPCLSATFLLCFSGSDGR